VACGDEGAVRSAHGNRAVDREADESSPTSPCTTAPPMSRSAAKKVSVATTPATIINEIAILAERIVLAPVEA
jgi:hypothetical protein